MRLPWAIRRVGASVLGRILLPIVGGPNRGFRWSLATSGRGCVTGRWEPHRLAAIDRFTQPGDVFCDVGAHKGYVTLLASRRVGDQGQVYAIEPSPVNLKFLRKHVAANRADNVRIVSVAVSGYDGECNFGGSGSSVAYRLGRGSHRVPVRTVETLVRDEGLVPPTVLKVDAEGEEANVLRGAGKQLCDDALVIVSIHSHENYTTCRDLLLARGFQVFVSPHTRKMAAREPTAWCGDPDLLGVGPARDVSQDDVRAFTGRP